MGKVTLMSFGFKYGPPNANYYFDVGFIKNPARENKWGFDSDADNDMKTFIVDQPLASEFIRHAVKMIMFLRSVDQNQVFAFGCSAGRHRSTIVVETIANVLKSGGVDVEIIHRDK